MLPCATLWALQCVAAGLNGFCFGWRSLAAKYNPYDHAFLSMKPKPTNIFDIVRNTPWRRLAMRGTEIRAVAFLGTRFCITRNAPQKSYVARFVVYTLCAATWSAALRATALMSSDATSAIVTLPQATRFIARTEGGYRAVLKGTGYALGAICLEHEIPSIVDRMTAMAALPPVASAMLKALCGAGTGLLTSRMWLAAECENAWKPKPIHPRMAEYGLRGLEIPLRSASVLSAVSAYFIMP